MSKDPTVDTPGVRHVACSLDGNVNVNLSDLGYGVVCLCRAVECQGVPCFKARFKAPHAKHRSPLPSLVKCERPLTALLCRRGPKPVDNETNAATAVAEGWWPICGCLKRPFCLNLYLHIFDRAPKRPHHKWNNVPATFLLPQASFDVAFAETIPLFMLRTDFRRSCGTVKGQCSIALGSRGRVARLCRHI